MYQIVSRILIGWLMFLALAAAQDRTRILVVNVRDQTGSPVMGAHVSLEGSGYSQTAIPVDDGLYELMRIPVRQSLTLNVTARGFANFDRTIAPQDSNVQVTLLPAIIAQQVTVTANRYETRMEETAENVDVLSRAALSTTAAESIDDALRQIPGFTLFRRSGSRTANPTTQGPSLRGVGTSGASRALVLYNDIPLNDPFGGWVYWGRIPREDVESIEVLHGGASSLYGSGALAGVVNVVPEHEQRTLFSSEFSGGSEGTPDFSALASIKLGKWTWAETGEFFRTSGYVLVPEDQRGAIDTAANSLHSSAESMLSRKIGRGDLFFGSSFYRESRQNGTPLQNNDTDLWQVSTGTNFITRMAAFQARLYGSGQSYNQSFSSIVADRNSESLVRLQHVPAQQAGGSLTASGSLGSRNTWVAGGDTRLVRGFSNETIFTSGTPSSLVSAGGRQLTSGGYVQDQIRLLPRLLLTAGVRYDDWDNFDAHSRTAPLSGTARPGFTGFTDESQHAFSPRASLLWRATHNLALTASAYKSFRAPTLNELYRAFRLGNVLTLANPNLTAERINGAETGANVSLGRLRLHSTFFYMQVLDPVANVTLTVSPANGKTLAARARAGSSQVRSGMALVSRSRRSTSSWTRL
jgi:outer membrane receptor protein involved in Fe transport